MCNISGLCRFVAQALVRVVGLVGIQSLMYLSRLLSLYKRDSFRPPFSLAFSVCQPSQDASLPFSLSFYLISLLPDSLARSIRATIGPHANVKWVQV